MKFKWKLNTSFASKNSLGRGRPKCDLNNKDVEEESNVVNENNKERLYHNLSPALSSLFLLQNISEKEFYSGCKYKIIKENALSPLNNMRMSSIAKVSTIRTHSHGENDNIERSIRQYRRIRGILFSYDPLVDKILNDYIDDNVTMKILPQKLKLLKVGLLILYKYFNN